MLANHRAKEVVVEGDTKMLICEHEGEEVRVLFDEILVTVGHAPNTKGFGLEELGVRISWQGTIETDAFLQSNLDI